MGVSILSFLSDPIFTPEKKGCQQDAKPRSHHEPSPVTNGHFIRHDPVHAPAQPDLHISGKTDIHNPPQDHRPRRNAEKRHTPEIHFGEGFAQVFPQGKKQYRQEHDKRKPSRRKHPGQCPEHFNVIPRQERGDQPRHPHDKYGKTLSVHPLSHCPGIYVRRVQKVPPRFPIFPF